MDKLIDVLNVLYSPTPHVEVEGRDYEMCEIEGIEFTTLCAETYGCNKCIYYLPKETKVLNKSIEISTKLGI